MGEQTIRVKVGEVWVGIYDPEHTFKYAEVVQDPTGLSIYRSLKSNNVGHPLTDTNYWRLVINLSHIKEVADEIESLHRTMQEKEGERQNAESERDRKEEQRGTAYQEAEGTENDSVAGDGSRWGEFKAAEARRQAAAEQSEGTENESQANDGSRWGGFKGAEQARNERNLSAEGSEAQSVAGDGSRWGAYKAAEALRNAALALVEGTLADSVADDGSRWGAYKAAEALRNAARALVEGSENESQAGDGSRWGAYLAAEALRNAARLLAEGTLADSEAGDGSRWGAYLAAEALRNAARLQAEGSSESTANDGSRWGAFFAAEAARNIIASALQTNIENGSVIAALAGNLKPWADRNNPTVEEAWNAVIRTAAGDTSINSAAGAVLVRLTAKSDFYASSFRTTGFNLLAMATAVGDGYYFPVPALPFGAYQSAAKPNGVLFTNSSHENLTPTVRFKKLSDGVPTTVNDGDACAYTDSHGYRFYNTSEPGFIIVSGITFATTCAHIAWSGRYNEYISPTAAADAGTTVALAATIHDLHSYDRMLVVGGVSDEILFGDTKATWYRRNDRTAPTWTTIDNGDGTYTHIATIATMKADGAAELYTSGKPLDVNGTTVSYTDDSATATEDYVKFNLATVATGQKTLSPNVSIEDFGLELFEGAIGSAMLVTRYAQGYPDSLAALVNGGLGQLMRTVAHLLCDLDQRIGCIEGGLEKGLRSLKVDSLQVNHRLDRYDFAGNRVLEGEGAPAVLADYVGQLYHDTTNNEWYIATGVTAVSQWKKISLT